MPRQYADNAMNRSLGRVGMAHGTAVVSRSSGGGGSSSYRSNPSNNCGSSSTSRSYVDNSMNRSLGRVGMPLGSAVHSRSSSSYSSNFGDCSSSPVRIYVDNPMNRGLGRVGMPLGSAVQSRISTPNSQSSNHGSASNRSTSASSSKVFVDNALNQSLGRVGLPHGSAVHSRSAQSTSTYVDNDLNRRMGRVGLDKGSAIHSKSAGISGAGSSSARKYVDNAYNRKLGRAGLPFGSAVNSKYSVTMETVKTYVDNALNRHLGRVGKPFGSMPVRKRKCSDFDFNRDYGNEIDWYNLPIDYSDAICTEIQNINALRNCRHDHIPNAGKLPLQPEEVIEFKDLDLDEKIGSGGFADVHIALWKGNQVAVKKLRVLRVSQVKKKQFEDEVRILCQLSHPCIVKFYGACIVTPNLAIVMEFMPDGSLYDNLYLEEDVQFSDETKNQFIRDAFGALVYLHTIKNMVHRDIKSKNIMLCDKRTHCKLTDFGLALRDDAESHSTVRDHAFAGTVKYCPREVLDGQRLTLPQLKCVDIYSLALTTLELLTETEPFDKLTIHQISIAIKNAELPSMDGFGISDSKKALLKMALSVDAMKRPTAEKFLSNFNAIANSG